MLRNHHLFNEQDQGLDQYASGDSFEVKEEIEDVDGETIPAGSYSVVENWEDFIMICNGEGNRYKYPK